MSNLKEAMRDLIRLAKENESALDLEFGSGRSVERMEEDCAFSGEIYRAEEALRNEPQ